jgi:hypothetical protein
MMSLFDLILFYFLSIVIYKYPLEGTTNFYISIIRIRPVQFESHNKQSRKIENAHRQKKRENLMHSVELEHDHLRNNPVIEVGGNEPKITVH